MGGRSRIQCAELSALASAAGANPVTTVTQTLNAPSPTYVGSGKLDEIGETVRDFHIETVICDDELTPAQQRVARGSVAGQGNR